MSCYTRHLAEPMRAAGLPFDRIGKHEADRRIRAGLKMEEADCPEVWVRLKQLTPNEVQALLGAPATS
jgi:hypothetical protein